jgi:hypothetical protein
MQFLNSSGGHSIRRWTHETVFFKEPDSVVARGSDGLSGFVNKRNKVKPSRPRRALHRLMISFSANLCDCGRNEPAAHRQARSGGSQCQPAAKKRPFLNPPEVKPGDWQGEILDGHTLRTRRAGRSARQSVEFFFHRYADNLSPRRTCNLHGPALS